ncbi:transglutaminase family protein [Pseudogulbenkiania sp. MAI-1]|uniref:transglutaminase family protein n=1 Tax=Pseudogulbenkiania sp. MAI-1 TaxID=990370 RepID=UPI00045E81C8|nr:transglutaminase family protein [Pseudogulbenkiania sp. MAI-1]
MKLSIRHSTQYRYAEPASRSTQYLRLTPRSNRHQQILSWRLILPAPASQSIDAFGNITHLMTLEAPHDSIELVAEGVVETRTDGWEDDAGGLNPLVFLRSTPLTNAGEAIEELARKAARPGDKAAKRLAALSQAVLAAMPYTAGVTDASTTASAALALGAGVCQDHTQVFIAACRHLGYPARYVSGYLLSGAVDHAASHAWAEVYADGGWLAFDISNQCTADDHHLKLAVGLDYLDACPVRGMRRGGAGETMHAHAAVEQHDN